MKCYVDGRRKIHLELDCDEASEFCLALAARSRVNALKAPGIEQMSDRLGQAVAHILCTPVAPPGMPEPRSPA